MRRAPVRHYLIAVSIVTLVALSKAPVEAVVGPGPLWILFVPVVILSAWLGGMGPGLLATALSSLICSSFDLTPIGSPRVQGFNDRFGLALFWAQGIMTCLLVERLRSAQRRAEEATRASESRTLTILESITDCFCAFDQNWRFTYLNSRAEKILRRSREDLLGRRCWDEFPAAVGTIFDVELHRAVDDQTPVAFEDYYPPLDAYLNIHAYPSGEGLLVYIADVTERKRSESQLAARESHLRAIIDNEPACVKLFAADGTLLEINPAGLRMIEADSFGEVENRCLYPLVAEEHRQAFVELNRSVFAGGSGTMEFQAVGLKGGRHWFETHVSPLRDATGEVASVLGITLDITDRKLAELALQNHATRLENLHAIDRAILLSLGTSEIAGSALIQLGKLVPSWIGCVMTYDFDRGEAEMVATLGSLVGMFPLGARIKLNPGAYRDIATLRSGHVVSIDETRDADSQGRPELDRLIKMGLRSYVFVPMIERGELIGMVCLGSDAPRSFATEHVEVCREVADQMAIAIREGILVEEIRSAKDRLTLLSRQLIRAKEEERRRISRELHDEIGQAMTALKINLQEVIGGREDAPVLLGESIAIVDQSLQQVRGMALDLHPSILDDFGLIAALEWYVGRQAQRTGLAGRVIADPDDIRADPEIETVCFRVTQEALTNVARHAQATRFSVELTQHTEGLQLVVRDDGRGFDPVAALHAAVRGTSLGLAGMRERVELVGGRIAFVSEPGGGSEVQVDLPNSPRPLRLVAESGGPR